MEQRKSYLDSFIEKINLLEIGPQSLIEVIQHPVITNQPNLEKVIRDALTSTLSKKFESADQLEVSDYQFSNSRCYHQQEVKNTLLRN